MKRVNKEDPIEISDSEETKDVQQQNNSIFFNSSIYSKNLISMIKEGLIHHPILKTLRLPGYQGRRKTHVKMNFCYQIL